jgi:catalase
MVLDRNVGNHFAENEQIAFGTGVLVDGLDFSDDKMLVGRTFSYSDTQRHRVGANYLQLPVNAPVAPVSTNQRDGQMAYHVDGTGENPHVNYEPSSTGGLPEAAPAGPEHRPHVAGAVGRQKLERLNDYAQPGERYRTMPDSERDDLVLNLVDLLGQCEGHIQQRMVEHFARCDEEFGRRVAEGLGVPAPAATAVG